MRIRKKFQGVLPEHKILDTASSSQTDTYSCRKINELVANAGGGGGTGGSGVSVDQIYPVGSIYISASATVDPNEVFLGTSWERFGKGRTLVSVNEDDDDFSTAGLTGGHKDMQEHTHGSKTLIGSFNIRSCNTGGKSNSITDASGIVSRISTTWSGSHDRFTTASNTNPNYETVTVNATHEHNASGTGDSGNLQPYITVFMWQRVA